MGRIEEHTELDLIKLEIKLVDKSRRFAKKIKSK